MLYRDEFKGFKPEYVLFDNRYAGLKNLKRIREFRWYQLTRLEYNRLINPDGSGNIAVSPADISEVGTEVHLNRNRYLLFDILYFNTCFWSKYGCLIY